MKSYKQKKVPDMFKVTEDKLKEKSNGKEKEEMTCFRRGREDERMCVREGKRRSGCGKGKRNETVCRRGGK